ncbi:MAG: cupin domain-containing protein [Dehalococcoidia bacterium]|nr:cupin domain-containing protein [Dehalococcoidia bacterium]MDW8120451.1 cupin domain-containing protein [Chloroflexota bacterium]
MYFYSLTELPPLHLFPGITARIASGEKVMVSVVDMVEGVSMPAHSHPHEQAGYVVEGEFEFEIGGQRRWLRPGDVYVIPSGVPHRVVAVRGKARAIDIFSPPREDYLQRR